MPSTRTDLHEVEPTGDIRTAIEVLPPSVQRPIRSNDGTHISPRRHRTESSSPWNHRLAVAVTAYIFMGLSWLEHLIFTFPELLLVILALVLLAGRYTGYRLLELARFRALMDR